MIVEIKPGERVYVGPLVLKNLSRGDNIPEEEELIQPYKNDDDPDTNKCEL